MELKLLDRDREAVEHRKETQDMKGKMLRYQQQNHDYEREVEELTTQLSISLQAREALYKSKTHHQLLITGSSNRRRKGTNENEVDDRNDSADEEEINDIINEITED
jgi:hypothetical protein